MDRVARGDEEAFGELFTRYAPFARSLAGRVLRQPFLADEIVQEVFLSLWRNPGSYDPLRGSVRAWVMTLTHRRAVDLIRREETAKRTALAVAQEPTSDADGPEAIIEESWLRDAGKEVVSALGELPPPQREVIELMYFDGLSQSKVAERLGLPLGTVKSRTLLGMRRLRRALLAVER